MSVNEQKKSCATNTFRRVFLGYVFIVLLLGPPATAKTLSPEFRKDIYFLELEKSLTAKDFKESLNTIKKLRALNVKLPNVLWHFEAVASCDQELYANCLSAAENYIINSGKAGEHYKNTLPLILLAEKEIAKEKAEKLRRKNSIISRNKEASKVFFYKALKFSQKGRYDLALDYYTRAIKLTPKNSTTIMNRGVVNYELGNLDNAIADYTRAIKLEKQDALMYTNRGLVYTKKHQYDRAISDFNRAIELRPRYFDAYEYRGTAYAYKGMIDHAMRDYEHLIEIQGANRVKLWQLILGKKGLYKGAIDGKYGKGTRAALRTSAALRACTVSKTC